MIVGFSDMEVLVILARVFLGGLRENGRKIEKREEKREERNWR